MRTLLLLACLVVVSCQSACKAIVGGAIGSALVQDDNRARREAKEAERYDFADVTTVVSLWLDESGAYLYEDEIADCLLPPPRNQKYMWCLKADHVPLLSLPDRQSIQGTIGVRHHGCAVHKVVLRPSKARFGQVAQVFVGVRCSDVGK